MASAYEMAVRLSNVIDNWNDIIADGLERSQDIALDLNREQLGEGITSDNKRITPAYKRFTVLAKQAKGQPTYVTLKDTGEFWSKFYVRISGDKWAIGSTDGKTTDLVRKYTDSIFGLTSESKRILWREQLRYEVLNIIRGYIKR